nr:hypothetical protein [Actinomadura madurae]
MRSALPVSRATVVAISSASASIASATAMRARDRCSGAVRRQPANAARAAATAASTSAAAPRGTDATNPPVAGSSTSNDSPDAPPTQPPPISIGWWDPPPVTPVRAARPCVSSVSVSVSSTAPPERSWPPSSPGTVSARQPRLTASE